MKAGRAGISHGERVERWRGLKILRGLGWAFHQLERGYVGGKTDPQGLALAGEERESAGELAREVLLLAGELMVGWREMAGEEWGEGWMEETMMGSNEGSIKDMSNRESIKESSKGSIKGSSKESSKEFIKESSKESINDSSKDSSKDPSKDSSNNPSKDSSKDSSSTNPSQDTSPNDADSSQNTPNNPTSPYLPSLPWQAFAQWINDQLPPDCILPANFSLPPSRHAAILALTHFMTLLPDSRGGLANAAAAAIAAERLLVDFQIGETGETESPRKIKLTARGKLAGDLHLLGDAAMAALAQCEEPRGKPSEVGKVVRELVRMGVSYSAEPVEALRRIVETVQQFGDEAVEPREFRSLTAGTFLAYYNAASETAVSVLESLELAGNEETAGVEALRRVLSLEELLVSVTRRNASAGVLAGTLRSFVAFMSVFLGPCASYLRGVLTRRPSEAVAAIKTLQRSTRQVQSLCAHAKMTREAMALRHVPRVKKQLEQVIYVIGDMLKQVGAEDAFWLGNLKNRAIDGQEIREEEPAKRVKVKEEQGEAMAVEEEAEEAGSEENEENEENETEETSEETEECVVCWNTGMGWMWSGKEVSRIVKRYIWDTMIKRITTWGTCAMGWQGIK